jgi:GAF domain-containing protein
VPVQFVTVCPLCGKEFMLLWVMDPIRVGPDSVAKITCPICAKRFVQVQSDLLAVLDPPNDLSAGRPVRTTELVYDCPSCGMPEIAVTLLHTDLSWEELSRETTELCVCSYSRCPKRGLQQKLHPTRTGLGALNPSTAESAPFRRTPEEQVVMADRANELLDSFEKGFRKAWVKNENETIDNGDQPIFNFLAKEVEEVCSRTSADGALIALRAHNGFRCVASTGDALAVGSFLQLHPQVTRDCLETSHIIICADVEDGWGIGLSTARSLFVRSAVVVPIQTQGSSVGVVEVFSSQPSAFCATDVAKLLQVANLLAADPDVLRIANSATPASAARPLSGAEPTARRSTLVFPKARLSSSAELQTGKQPPLGLCRPEPLPDSLGAAIEREPESPSDRRIPARWLTGVAALFFLAFLSWFGLSRPRAIKISSGPAVPADPGGGGQVDANAENPVNATGRESSDHSHLGAPLSAASPPSSKAEEEKVPPKLGLVPEEHDNSLATSLPSPSGSQLNPQPADSTAAVAGDANPTEALSSGTRTGSLAPPAPTVEATNLEPVEPPRESSEADTPAVIPAINSPLNPPTPIRSVGVSRTDFVLDHTLKGHSGWVTGVAFSPDGRRLASGSWDQTVKFWNVSTGQELSTVGGKMNEVQAVAFSHDGHWLAAENSSDTVTVWDATTGRQMHTLSSNKPLGIPGSNWVYSIAFSPDGRWLASGVDDKTVRLWDVATGRMVRDLTGLRRSVMYTAFSPDGHWLASGDDAKNIRIWDASTGQEIQRLSGHKKAIYAVLFSPDGRWLASASADKTVRLWDVVTGQEVHTFTGHGNIVTSLAFSPDGRWLASGSWDKTIKIWDVETGLEVQTLVGHDHPVYSIAFDPSGRWLASGSEDGKINLWRWGRTAEQARSR